MVFDDLVVGKTSSQIEQMIELRIRDGRYLPGTQLPTVRALAQAIGVNKNTVVRAYQALERKGYLSLIRGRGAFVIERQQDAASLLALPWDAVDALVHAAKQQHIGQQRLLDAFRRRLEWSYGTDARRAAFIECNQLDIDTLSAELGAATGRTFEGILVADVPSRTAELLEQFDVIVTTFFHLGQISQMLGDASAKLVIGVHATPSHDTLLKIARLHAAVIGLVCEFLTTVESLSHIIKTYQPNALILTMLISDPQLPSLLAKVDAVVVTRSCYTRLMELQPHVTVIPVSFIIEQQSVEFVRKRMNCDE